MPPAAHIPTRGYRRRNPEAELLYQILAQHDDMSSYLARARFSYLDTYRDRAKSDLVLDGWRSLDDITGEIVAVLKSRKASRVR